MTHSYLYVTVSTRERSQYPVSINLRGRRFAGSIDRGELDSLIAGFRVIPVAEWLSWGRRLHGLVFPPDAAEELLRIAAEPKPEDYFLVLRLSVEPPELAGLPWELLTPPPSAPSDTFPFHVVRYSDKAHREGLDSLPVEALIAPSVQANTPGFDLEDRLRWIFPSHDWMQRTFRPTRRTWDRLRTLGEECRGRRVDILHLVGLPDQLSSAEEVHRLVEAIGPRLVVLQTAGAEPEGPIPAAHVAAGLVSTGTPAVVASDLPAQEARPFFAALYDALVHDTPIDAAVEYSRRELWRMYPGSPLYARPALFLGRFGEESLRLSPLAANVQRRATAAIARVEGSRRKLEQLSRGGARAARREAMFADVQERGEALRRTEDSLRAGRDQADIPHWRHETSGIVPLEAATRMVEAAEAAANAEADRLTDLEELAEQDEPRVVNTYFSEAGVALRRDQSLRTSQHYDFFLQIGPVLRESIVLHPRAIPEEALEPFYAGAGLTLQVALFSSDFRMERDTADLLLPRAGATTPLRFAVAAPERPGRARLRASIYFRGNLLQSVLARATVTRESAEGLADGNLADVDYCFSGTFQHLEDLPSRTVNILTNESADGTHTFAVRGTDLKEHFDLTEGEMNTAILAARSRYLETCSEMKDGKPFKYRFGDDNRGDEERFLEDLKHLAWVGYKLCVNVLHHKDSEFGEELREILNEPASIQISSSRSAKYVVPWAVFYDRRLVYKHDRNEVCAEFLTALKAGGPPGYLERQACLNGRCPNQGDPNVICPSGFWGFKHIIEQPPSTTGDSDGRRGNGAARDVMREIVARGLPEFLMAVNQDLPGWSRHEAEVKGIRPLEFRQRATRDDIGLALKAPQPHLVYFYCHGRKSGTEPWLGVGVKGHEEQLLPTDLDGWDIGWSTSPLVFINGCHTVDMTPDDLVNFVNAFTYCKASGVIGTEIAVPESLAQAFACGFLGDFLREGRRVGEILRRQRLLLLEKRNPLGLVYTPYCSADLKMTIRSAPTLDVLMIEARRSPGYAAVETEAPVLEKVWNSAGLKYRIVSNDARLSPGPGASKRDFVDVLRTEWSSVVHLALHGDGASLSLRWSDEADPGARRTLERLRPAEIGRLELTGSVVVSGACLSGMNTLAEAFLKAGAKAYVAPVERVEWAGLVPFFKAFYEALATGGSLRKSLDAGCGAAPEAGKHYRITGDEGAVLGRVP